MQAQAVKEEAAANISYILKLEVKAQVTIL